jgi:hypothetical protein
MRRWTPTFVFDLNKSICIWCMLALALAPAGAMSSEKTVVATGKSPRETCLEKIERRAVVLHQRLGADSAEASYTTITYAVPDAGGYPAGGEARTRVRIPSQLQIYRNELAFMKWQRLQCERLPDTSSAVAKTHLDVGRGQGSARRAWSYR